MPPRKNIKKPCVECKVKTQARSVMFDVYLCQLCNEKSRYGVIGETSAITYHNVLPSALSQLPSVTTTRGKFYSLEQVKQLPKKQPPLPPIAFNIFKLSGLLREKNQFIQESLMHQHKRLEWLKHQGAIVKTYPEKYYIRFHKHYAYSTAMSLYALEDGFPYESFPFLDYYEYCSSDVKSTSQNSYDLDNHAKYVQMHKKKLMSKVYQSLFTRKFNSDVASIITQFMIAKSYITKGC